TEEAAASTDSETVTVAGVLTAFGAVLGTCQYMSPEQARGHKVDGRSDIFSFGVVMHEMIGGRPPFQGETTSHVIVAILEKEPLPLSPGASGVPAELERILSKALRKDREERYQTIKDLYLDLKSLKQALDLQAQLGRTQVAAASRGGE